MFILFGRWHFGRKAVGYERIQEIEDSPRHKAQRQHQCF